MENPSPDRSFLEEENKEQKIVPPSAQKDFTKEDEDELYR